MAIIDIQPMPRYSASDSLGNRKPTVNLATMPNTASAHRMPNSDQPQAGSMATSANGV